jgi:hypothetical protein
MNLIVVYLLMSSGHTSLHKDVMWGSDGHRLVCEIAWRHLTPEARSLVTRLRGRERGRFAESCTWADEVRDQRPETYHYHFINIPAGKAGMDMRRDCGDPAKRCAPWAIQHYGRIVADASKPLAARGEALKWLGHFVGDVHQPLHAGRPQDRGGNEIHVSFFGDAGDRDDRMQLHSIWDNGVLRRANLRWPASADELIAGISTVDVSAWSNSDVVGWTNESYRLDEEFVYSVRDGGDVANAYYSRALPIARRRIQQGGIRLAHLLNEAARGRSNITL